MYWPLLISLVQPPPTWEGCKRLYRPDLEDWFGGITLSVLSQWRRWGSNTGSDTTYYLWAPILRISKPFMQIVKRNRRGYWCNTPEIFFHSERVSKHFHFQHPLPKGDEEIHQIILSILPTKQDFLIIKPAPGKVFMDKRTENLESYPRTCHKGREW